jgi:Flp pilus assembly protein TadG
MRPDTTTPRRRQRGSYAVEFAIIFPVLFGLVYALLSYGLVVSVRLYLQYAAEEGARAGLRYQVVSTGSQLPARITASQTVARNLLGWLPAPPQVQARVCRQDANVCTDGALPVTCGWQMSQACRMEVTVTYDYAGAPIAPALPGFGLLMPSTVMGQASVMLDGRALGS